MVEILNDMIQFLCVVLQDLGVVLQEVLDQLCVVFGFDVGMVMDDLLVVFFQFVEVVNVNLFSWFVIG